MDNAFLAFLAISMLWFLTNAMEGEFWEILRLPLAVIWLIVHILFIVSMGRLTDALKMDGGNVVLFAFFLPFFGTFYGYRKVGEAAKQYFVD